MSIAPLVVIAGIVLVRRWLQRKAAWRRAKHPSGLYSFEYPGHWSGVIAPDGIEIASPDKRARATAVAFTDDAGRPLSERSAMRFSVTTIAVTKNSLLPARETEGPGWKGVIYEEEGLARDTSGVVHETTLCAESGNLFVVLCVSVDIGAGEPEVVEHVLRSLRLKPETAGARQPPAVVND